MGAPKATATPAALAALSISRRLPVLMLVGRQKGCRESRQRTFVVFILGKVTTNNISDTACYVHKRTFLAEVETRCDGQSQTNSLSKESATSEVTMYNKTCRYKLS